MDKCLLSPLNFPSFFFMFFFFFFWETRTELQLSQSLSRIFINRQVWFRIEFLLTRKVGFKYFNFSLSLSPSLSLDFRYLLLALQHVWRRRRKCRRAQNRRRYLSLPLSLPTYINILLVFSCFLVWWAEFLKAKCLMNCEVALILEHKYDQLQQMSDDPRNQVSQWVFLSFLSIVISKIRVVPWFMNLNLSPANPAYDYVDCLAKRIFKLTLSGLELFSLKQVWWE